MLVQTQYDAIMVLEENIGRKSENSGNTQRQSAYMEGERELIIVDGLSLQLEKI